MPNQDYIFIGNHKNLVNKKERLLYRFFEILPGFLAWGSFILAIVLSFTAPSFMAIFIIVFDLYWFFRIAYFHFHLTSAFRMMRKQIKIDWSLKLGELESRLDLDWHSIYHLVILPFYKEDLAIVRNTVQAIKESGYPLDKVILVLAAESRSGDYGIEVAKKVEAEYKNTFYKLLTTFHPDNLPGELAGKGANTAWAGRIAKEFVDSQVIPYENVIVSSFDIDTVVPRSFFHRLTYVYATTKDRLHASYQPIPLYTNNIWEAPIFSRVAAFSTTFWAMLNQERPNRLKTFSSHSMPFQALVDVDFWKKDIVTEDNIIFFQCFLRYNGNYRVVPLYFPVYMDANVAPTVLQTAVNIYKQHRRWGWGVETIPYMLYGFWKNKLMPWHKKIDYAFEYIEGFWSWSTNSIIIAVFGWLPVLLGGDRFRQSVLALNVQSATSIILNLFLIFLVFSVVFSIMLLPLRPKGKGNGSSLVTVLQWALTPVIMIFLICIPALDAQTRLMFGKYMGFWVTPKSRSNPKTGNA